MSRFRWYGPTLVLVAVVVLLLVAGPAIVSRIAQAEVIARSGELKQQLANDPSLAKLSDAFRKVAEAVEPSVVHIEVFRKQGAAAEPNLEDLFRRYGHVMPPDDQQDQPIVPRRGPRNNNPNMDRYNVPREYASGSGWVYDKDGHIITNNHVVNGADKIVVRFNDGTERTATVTGVDPKTDVAVIKVSGDGLIPATLAAKPVQQGDIVFAFGSPFQFEFSMSQGIVSGKGRHLGILRDDQGFEGYEDFIQTDAAINPGNSGGPLVDIHGDVVGMNSAIASRTGTNNGLGFAIPSVMIQGMADQLIKNGKVTRGYLGILLVPQLDPKMAQSFGFKGKGVLVEGLIDGGPAEAGGVKRGDIITRIEGTETPSADLLRSMVAAMPAGKKADIEVFRDGKTVKLTATIAEQPTEMANAASGRTPAMPAPGEKGTQTLRQLGIESLADMTENLADQMRVPFEAGVLIRSVRSDSAAESANIGRGSIITDVAGVKVSTVKELADEIAKHDLVKGVRVTVVEGGRSRFAILALPQE